MTIDDLRAKVSGYLDLERRVASATDFRPDAACRVGSSRFSTGIEMGGVLGRYDHARFFFEAAAHAFSVLPREQCLYRGAAPGQADDSKIHESWQAGFALATISAALRGSDVPEREPMLASAEALSLLVGNGLVHGYTDRADPALSAGILDMLCLAYLLPLWGAGAVDGNLVDRCLNVQPYEPFEAIHRATSAIVRQGNDAKPEFDTAYRHLARASNFNGGLISGMRIIHVFHLSLVRNEGEIRPAIEHLLPENE